MGLENEGQKMADAAEVNSAVSGEGSGAAVVDSTPATKETTIEKNSSGQADPAAVQADPAAIPAFKADYKLKVMDQEKEIPEAFRSLMKDEKSAKEIKEIFEKSFGHEFTKPKYETLKSSHTELQQTHTSVINQINDLKADYAKGDLDSFFDKLKIPQDAILRYALEKVQYQELPPEQKAVIDAKRQAELEATRYSRENQELSQSLQAQMVQARTYALDTELARSDVKSMADAYDARIGKPGAFKEEVINRGQLRWQQSQGKVDLLPGQAIAEVAMLAGLSGAPTSAQAISAPAAAVVQAAPAAAIPNVGGSKSASPVKQKPRSIEDLKKLAAEM